MCYFCLARFSDHFKVGFSSILRYIILGAFGGRFWILDRVALKILFREGFGRSLEANLAPSWSQVGARLGPGKKAARGAKLEPPDLGPRGTREALLLAF